MPETENNTNKISIWMPLLIAIALAGGLFVGTKITSKSNVSNLDYALEGKEQMGPGSIEEILRYIESKYIYEVDREELVTKAIDNLLEELDPHSSYISAADLKEVNANLEGDFDGIGIEFMVLEDSIFIINAIKDGPAAQAGLLAGDRIVEIEDSIVAGVGINIRKTIAKLKGEAGTDVNVSVFRPTISKTLPFKITRNTIPDHSVDAGLMIDESTAYFKMNRFSSSTYEEFMHIMEDLSMNQGMKNLIIDLRQNPGGYLQEATKLINQFFVEKDKLMVYTEGHSVHKNEYRTTGKSFFDIDDICILIDEGSVSASEIVAGALQDLDRGTIIGRRSFGKGLVQEQYNLSDGSALRLTVAKYYLPSGRCIQKDYASGSENYEADIHKRYESGEFSDSTKMQIADSMKYYTIKGREVYGGGGITPDVFVPIDSIFQDDFIIQARSYINPYSFRFVERNRNKMTKDTADFINQFVINESDFIDFTKLLKKNKIEVPLILDTKVKNYLSSQLKAAIGRYSFGNDAYYKISLLQDNDFKKAIQIINGKKHLVEKTK